MGTSQEKYHPNTVTHKLDIVIHLDELDGFFLKIWDKWEIPELNQVFVLVGKMIEKDGGMVQQTMCDYQRCPKIPMVEDSIQPIGG